MAGFGRVGQMVGRLLVGRGYGVTIIEHDPNQIELVRRFGWKAYYGEVTRLDVLQAAGIAQARLFVLAIDDPQAALKTAALVKTRYPHVQIVVRARNRSDAFEFFERETFRGGVALAEKALVALGEDAAAARSAAAAFIDHDEKLMAESVAIRDDQKKLQAITSRSRKDLEELMAREHAGSASKPET